MLFSTPSYLDAGMGDEDDEVPQQAAEPCIHPATVSAAASATTAQTPAAAAQTPTAGSATSAVAATPSEPATPAVAVAAAATTTPSSSSTSEGPRREWPMSELYDTIVLIQLDLDEPGFCLLGAEEPTSIAEAEKHACWRQEMEEELSAITKNETRELMELPKALKPIGLKRVYKVKKNTRGDCEAQSTACG